MIAYVSQKLLSLAANIEWPMRSQHVFKWHGPRAVLDTSIMTQHVNVECYFFLVPAKYDRTMHRSRGCHGERAFCFVMSKINHVSPTSRSMDVVDSSHKIGRIKIALDHMWWVFLFKNNSFLALHRRKVRFKIIIARLEFERITWFTIARMLLLILK